MHFYIDLDDTILIAEKSCCPECGRINYKNAKPIQKTIDKVNKLYYTGHVITIWTGRKEDCRLLTEKQLLIAGVRYHDLLMGKPVGIYVDATNNYRDLEEFR